MTAPSIGDPEVIEWATDYEPCVRGVCDGSGLLVLVDFTGGDVDVCPCVDDLVVNLPRTVAERMERAIAAEHARRRESAQ